MYRQLSKQYLKVFSKAINHFKYNLQNNCWNRQDTIEIAFGSRPEIISKNHAKIIAVDGQLLIEGGHNLWDEHYLRKSPVHDVSLEVAGGVAVHAHYFLDELWRSLCRYALSDLLHKVGGYKNISTYPRKNRSSRNDKCPPQYRTMPLLQVLPSATLGITGLGDSAGAASEGTRVISVGRVGGWATGACMYIIY